MIVECTSCGAPLETGSASSHVKCGYCDKTNRVKSMRTVAMERPADWKPPPKWTPPETAKAASSELSYRHRWPPLIRWFEAVAVLAAAAGTVAVFYFSFPPGEVKALAGGPDAIGSVAPTNEVVTPWDGAEPYTCSGAAKITLVGARADLPHRTAIEVSGDCELTLRDAEITAWEGVAITDNGRLIIENSSLHTVETTISASGDAVVDVADSRLSSAGEAIRATRRARVVLAGGSVSGAPRAIARTAEQWVEVRDTVIEDATAL